MTTIRGVRRPYCILVGCLVAVSVQSFTSPTRITARQSNIRLFSQDDDWLYGDDDKSDFMAGGGAPDGMGRSQIPQFIDDFLEKEREKRGEGPKENIYTHMIGVPMTDCHQLQIELESVQRAVLYHCPSLVHACIVPSTSRMPLLYVDASREPPGSVTMELTAMVQKIVKKHLFVKQEEGEEETTPSPAEEANYAGTNQEGYKPLTMTFHKLQIDGEGNDALFTVADKDTDGGLEKLQLMVQELQDEIHAKGWKSMWPPNNVQGMNDQPEKNVFVPRIPLMRLPPDFERFLPPLEDNGYRPPEDGGNGISPVFWIKWEKDVMGRNVRLREMAIYPRRPGMNALDEQTFYIPHETVEFPGGNEALSQQEKVHEDYNEKRMKEAERQLEEEDGAMSPDGDFMDPNLSDNRKILESIFAGKDADESQMKNANSEEDDYDDDDDDMIDWSRPIADGVPLDDWMVNRINDIVQEEDAEAATDSSPSTEPIDVEATNKTASADISESSPPLDDWMQDRLRDIVENRPSQVAKQPAKKKNVPSLDENKIFQAYRDGTLTKKREALGVSVAGASPFPSDEALRGFWKVVRSPLSSPLEKKEESRSDNFVLRVDGTISGGPILDPETLNKASAGTWSMVENLDETQLRIRLVIPPKKNRIMVWEGELYEEQESISNTASVLEATTFGKTEASSDEKVIKCSGTVSSFYEWMLFQHRSVSDECLSHCIDCLFSGLD